MALKTQFQQLPRIEVRPGKPEEMAGALQRWQDEARGVLNPALAALSAQPKWLYVGQPGAPAFSAGWVPWGNNFAGPRFTKDLSGVVHLSGLTKSGTVGFSIADAIFALPVGYRPAFALIFPVSSNAAFGEVRIGNYDTNTRSDVVCTVGNNAFVSLDGISFLAEQ